MDPQTVLHKHCIGTEHNNSIKSFKHYIPLCKWASYLNEMALTPTTWCCSSLSSNGYRTFLNRFPACEQNNRHLLECGVISF